MVASRDFAKRRSYASGRRGPSRSLGAFDGVVLEKISYSSGRLVNLNANLAEFTAHWYNTGDNTTGAVYHTGSTFNNA